MINEYYIQTLPYDRNVYTLYAEIWQAAPLIKHDQQSFHIGHRKLLKWCSSDGKKFDHHASKRPISKLKTNIV